MVISIQDQFKLQYTLNSLRGKLCQPIFRSIEGGNRSSKVYCQEWLQKKTNGLLIMPTQLSGINFTNRVFVSILRFSRLNVRDEQMSNLDLLTSDGMQNLCLDEIMRRTFLYSSAGNRGFLWNKVLVKKACRIFAEAFRVGVNQKSA